MRATTAIYLAAGLLLAPAIRGDVISGDGRYHGVVITGAQLARLQSALNDMETLGRDVSDREIEDCAKCLKEMLAHHRICLETGTHNSAASTWSGKEAGRCGDASDGMHIGPSTLDGRLNSKSIMAILAHEWKHTTQSSCDPVPQREVEGYSAGKHLLAACGETSGVRVQWYDQKIAAWQQRVRNGSRTPGHGSRSARNSDNPPSDYTVFSGESVLWFGDPNTPLEHSVPLQRFDNGSLIDPTDLLIIESAQLPQGSVVIIVSGIDVTDGTTGVIQYFDVNAQNQSVQPLFEHVMPMTHPLTCFLRADAEPRLNRMFVLDTLNNEILQLRPPLGDPIGVPFELDPFPFATTATSERLASAQGIGPQGTTNAIRITDIDGRADGLGIYNQTVVDLIDQNGDGQADQAVQVELHTQTRLLPALDSAPRDGDDSVIVGGTPGTTIEVRTTTKDGTQVLEVLAQGVPSSDFLVTMAMPREFVQGEFVQAVDLDDPDFGLDLPPYEVGPCSADLDGDGTVDSNDFFAYLDLFAIDDPAGDLTGDGVIDSDDFFEYLDRFQRCIS